MYNVLCCKISTCIVPQQFQVFLLTPPVYVTKIFVTIDNIIKRDVYNLSACFRDHLGQLTGGAALYINREAIKEPSVVGLLFWRRTLCGMKQLL